MKHINLPGLAAATSRRLQQLTFTGLVILAGPAALAQLPTADDFALLPPTIKEGADPFVMIDLSVELTQQAEAFTDGNFTYDPFADTDAPLVCNDRIGGVGGFTVGICYADTITFVGYFDPFKCYDYDDSDSNTNTQQQATGPRASTNAHHFVPVGPTSAGTHQCSGQFSGNFLNWAGMTALDEFRMVMTGGARLIDDIGASAKTLLVRARRYDDWRFVEKAISRSGLSATSGGSTRTYTVDPATVTPFNVDTLLIRNRGGAVVIEGRQEADFMRFFEVSGGTATLLTTDTATGFYNGIVEVCKDDSASGIALEANCVRYTDGTSIWYKPEGLLQRNALKIRYALMSYQGVDGNVINGGILRAQAKYIGAMRPATGGGLEVNPNAETTAQGQIVWDPDGQTGASGVNNSGVLNYINHFALSSGRYKSNDPVAELYYESIRYIKNIVPTPEYSTLFNGGLGLSDVEKDNFPVLTTWEDPVIDACQSTNVLYVGDQFAWSDHNLPGMAGRGPLAGTPGVPAVPSNADPDIDAWSATNRVGALEGFNNGAGNLGDATRGRSNNGWWFAGLSYYARNDDLRDETSGGVQVFPGVQYAKTFVIDTREYNGNPPQRWNNPLWLAAKYGGYTDEQGQPDDDPNNGVPPNQDATISTTRWDEDGDQEPDTFTQADQPTKLVSGLTRAFTNIVERLSATSAVAVVANSSTGTGALYQGLYEPRKVEGSEQVTWSGSLWGYFVDEEGRVREDATTVTETRNGITITHGNRRIDTSDPYLEFTVARIGTEDVVGANLRSAADDSLLGFKSLPELGKLWNAHDELAGMANVSQRGDYETGLAESGRYMLTWLDSNNDGIVDAGETVGFTDTVFADPAVDVGNNNFRLLGLSSIDAAKAPDIVNYIRGEEIVGMRNRSILGYVHRLGDMVNSPPTPVGPPISGYDLSFEDDSYAQFREQYRNRRQVVYIGGNDGMLHAFNGGFWDPNTKSFTQQLNGEVTHRLGAELWAYVPRNLLPHLRWLTETDYPHVYYVDGKPKAYDVNIFPRDADHPQGWGTILVVNFRFGGGDITIDPDSDLDVDTSDDITMRSAYVVLDITNPEKPPVLLAELSHAEMGYTTAEPTVIQYRKKRANGSFIGRHGANNNNKWWLVMGSGPTGIDAVTKSNALTEAVSAQNAKLFFYDLHANAGSSGMLITDTGQAQSFIGGLSSDDTDEDYDTDAVYYGTVGRTTVILPGPISSEVPTGILGRVRVKAGASGFPDHDDLRPFVAVNQPVSAAPLVSRDALGQPWLYFGTGRFLVTTDVTLQNQESFYGVKETLNGSGAYNYASVSLTQLVDVTGVQVNGDESIADAGGNSPVNLTGGGSSVSATTFSEMLNFIDGQKGWKRDLSTTYNRNTSSAVKFSNLVLFIDYRASGDTCEPAGVSSLSVVHERTGTAAPFAAIGYLDPSNQNGQTIDTVELGEGYVSGIATQDRGDEGTGFTNLENATIEGTALTKQPGAVGRQTWREIFLE